MMPSK
jgi:hypothetical protein